MKNQAIIQHTANLSWHCVRNLGLSLALLLSTQAASAVTVLLNENFEQVTGLTATHSRAVKNILNDTPTQLTAGLTIGEPISAAGFISVRSADNGLNTNPFRSFNNFFSSNFLAMNIETGFDRTTDTAFGITQLTIPVAPLASMAAGNFIHFSFDYILDGAIHASSNQSFSAYLADDIPTTAPPGVYYSTNAIDPKYDPSGGVSGHFDAIYDLTASSFRPTKVRLYLSDGPGSSFATRWAGGFDNFRVEASETNNFNVPEPAPLALMTLAIIALLRQRLGSGTGKPFSGTPAP